MFQTIGRYESKFYKKNHNPADVRYPKTIKDAWANQKELLVARDWRIYQEVCSKIHKMSTKQSSAHKES